MSFYWPPQLNIYKYKLGDTALYAGLLLASAEGFGLLPRLFLPFGQKRPYQAVLAHFWFPVVTLVTFSSNISKFEENPPPKKSKKNPKKNQKIKKKSKIP